MTDNPNTTPATMAYREDVHNLRIQLELAIHDLVEIEEAHAHGVAHAPTGLHSVAHYKLNLALDLLGDVKSYLLDEEQSGVAK